MFLDKTRHILYFTSFVHTFVSSLLEYLYFLLYILFQFFSISNVENVKNGTFESNWILTKTDFVEAAIL